jgi:hypothetical protein
MIWRAASKIKITFGQTTGVNAVLSSVTVIASFAAPAYGGNEALRSRNSVRCVPALRHPHYDDHAPVCHCYAVQLHNDRRFNAVTCDLLELQNLAVHVGSIHPSA